MSVNIRPEIRTWGPEAGVTCTTDEAALLILTLSRLGGEDVTPTVSDDGDYTRFHWDPGHADTFLEKLKGLVLVSDADWLIRMSMEDAGEVLGPQKEGMRAFLSNLKAKIKEWQQCIEDDPEHGLDLLMG